MKLTIFGTIERVVPVRSGIKDDRPWIFYRVTIAGRNFNTYDHGYGHLVGRKCQWFYEPTKYSTDLFPLVNSQRAATDDRAPSPKVIPPHVMSAFMRYRNRVITAAAATAT